MINFSCRVKSLIILLCLVPSMPSLSLVIVVKQLMSCIGQRLLIRLMRRFAYCRYLSGVMNIFAMHRTLLKKGFKLALVLWKIKIWYSSLGWRRVSLLLLIGWCVITIFRQSLFRRQQNVVLLFRLLLLLPYNRT
jgi:hypothetical protein